jgi:hypothetical protein
MINILDCLKVALNSLGHYGYDRIIEGCKLKQINKQIVTPKNFTGVTAGTTININGTLATGERATMFFNTMLSYTLMEYVKDQLDITESKGDSYMGDDYKNYNSTRSIAICKIGALNYCGGIGQSDKALVNCDRYEWLRNTYDHNDLTITGSVNRSISVLCSGNWENQNINKSGTTIFNVGTALANQVNNLHRRGLKTDLFHFLRNIYAQRFKSLIKKSYGIELDDCVVKGKILNGGLGFGDEDIITQTKIVEEINFDKRFHTIHKSIEDKVVESIRKKPIWTEEQKTDMIRFKLKSILHGVYQGQNTLKIIKGESIIKKRSLLPNHIQSGFRMKRVFKEGRYKLFFSMLSDIRRSNAKKNINLVPNRVECKLLGGKKKVYRQLIESGEFRSNYDDFLRMIQDKDIKLKDKYASVGDSKINSEIEKMFLMYGVEIDDQICGLGKY